MPDAVALLTVAEADSTRNQGLPEEFRQWAELLDAEERRARGGTPLTAARVAAILAGEGGTAIADPAALDAALRPGGAPRPVWVRALSAAAAINDVSGSEVVAALLLCAAGVTDRIRFLPFVGVAAAERATAIGAWREGNAEPWARAALGAAAAAARSLRVALGRAHAALATDAARLDALGRAAITARRAVAALHARYALTVPTLARHLACSRPAAGDALDRLVETGIAAEVTGRARDRVFALASAYALVSAE